MDSLQVESSYYNNNVNIPNQLDYVLSDIDKLCFSCPLPDCKDKSVKCPINKAKANEKTYIN